mgnify:FL=1
MSRRHISVVIPVKDERPEAISDILTIKTTDKWHDLRYDWEILIVDDGSRVPFPGATLRHERSQGYGAALKAGIRAAHGEWVVTADGDGQHRWRDIQRLVEFMEEFPENAMVIGNRRVKEPTVKRLLGRKMLNALASLFAGKWISDLNSGLRIFRKDIALGYFPILCNQFSFTTSLTLAFLADGYLVDWLPIRVLERRRGQSHVKVWSDGFRTLWYILWIGGALRTRGLRRVWRSLHR